MLKHLPGLFLCTMTFIAVAFVGCGDSSSESSCCQNGSYFSCPDSDASSKCFDGDASDCSPDSSKDDTCE